MNLYEVYTLFDITPIRGSGCYVYDQKGREYLDFYGGHAVISIGHAHRTYVDAVTKQVKRLGFYSNSVRNPLQQQLADKLESVSDVNGYDLFLINSGAEANENALKLASFYNKRRGVIALNNGFHGRTSAAINVTQSGQKHQSAINQGIEVAYFELNQIENMLAEIRKAKSAAVIIEAIQGVGGLDAIENKSLQVIAEACAESDTVLIMDEVQCGYGRSGMFFAFQESGIQPDLITIAKGMGNGFPVGGLLINSVKMPPVKGRLGTTYGGNHLACAASIAVLEVIEDENLMENAAIQGGHLKEAMSLMRGVRTVKGRGLMIGAEFDFPIADFRRTLVSDHQLFTGSSSNPNILRILPPLTVTEGDCNLFLEKMDNALRKL